MSCGSWLVAHVSTTILNGRNSSLDHFEYQLNTVLEGIAGKDRERKPIRIALLAGADLIQTMSQPGKPCGSLLLLWALDIDS